MTEPTQDIYMDSVALAPTAARPVRVCFAFSQDLKRCDMPAGHPGNHTITYEWSDDECYMPSGPSDPVAAVQRFEQRPVDDVADVPLGVCVACDHSAEAHDDEVGCLIGSGGETACGCRRFV